eukprot:863724_1
MDDIRISLIFNLGGNSCRVDWQMVMEYSKDIADVLNQYGKDFMLFVKFKGLDKDSDMENIQLIMENGLKVLEDKYLVQLFHETETEYWQTKWFVICNKYCHINGYSGNGYYVH